MVKEIFMSQFTTSTTCYSGARDANSLRFATEHHSLRLVLSNSGLADEQVDDHPVVTWESLRDELNGNHSNSNDSMICVGQSSCPTVDGGDCQVVCLLQSGVDQHQQMQSTGGAVENSSSTSTAPQHATDGMPQNRSHQRRITHDGALTTTMASTTAMFHNSSDGLSIANNSFQRSSWAHQHPPQHVTTSTTGAGGTTSLLRLTVSRRPSTVSTEDASTQLNDSTVLLERYTSQPLPFRPLAPCVSQLRITATDTRRTTIEEGEFPRGNDDSSSIICVTGVWVGSADDNLLRLFLPDDGGTLEEKRLGDHAGFLFQSPVMALEFFGQDERSHQKRNRLAVACQDGTIRLLGFQCRGTEHAWSFVNVEEYTVIVDGPIVCLHWNHQPEQHGTMQVVAGSLCGYVCSLQKSPDQSTWQGPTMVAQGFWDPRLQTEDSVLAVHCHGNYVAFGTYSGKVWVYSLHSSLGDYQIAWKCQLHYPIHGVCFIPTSLSNSSSHSTIELVVTTRRTLHILQHQLAKRPPLRQARYSAELAKERLERLLAERNVLSCSTDFVTLGPDELQHDEPDDVWILL